MVNGKVCGKTGLMVSLKTEIIQSLLHILLNTTRVTKYSLPVLAAGHYNCCKKLLSLGEMSR